MFSKNLDRKRKSEVYRGRMQAIRRRINSTLRRDELHPKYYKVSKETNDSMQAQFFNLGHFLSFRVLKCRIPMTRKWILLVTRKHETIVNFCLKTNRFPFKVRVFK